MCSMVSLIQLHSSACTSLPAPVAPPHPQPLEDVGGGPVHYKGMDHKGVVHIAEEGNLLRAGEGLDVCSLELCCGLQVVLKLGAAADGSVVHSLGRGRVNTAGILVTPLTHTHRHAHTCSHTQAAYQSVWRKVLSIESQDLLSHFCSYFSGWTQVEK